MKVATGEEDEECILRLRAKLYRFRDSQWKERGLGNARLMRHKESKKIRFIMRQEKTLKPVANFVCKLDISVLTIEVQESPLCELKPMQGQDKAFVWSCNDCSDDEPAIEKLALRLQTAEVAKKFKEAFDAAKTYNQGLKDGKTDLVEAPVVEDEPEEVEKKEEEAEKKPEETAATKE